MKHIISILGLAGVLALTACQTDTNIPKPLPNSNPPTANIPQMDSNTLPLVIEVLDFHTMHRCKTCLAIENGAKQVVETAFAEEVKTGKVVFKTVNVEEPTNAQLAEKFEASGSALFLYNRKTDTKVDLTELAFMYGLSNPQKFQEDFKKALQKSLE
jgi:hypothetical protein